MPGNIRLTLIIFAVVVGVIFAVSVVIPTGLLSLLAVSIGVGILAFQVLQNWRRSPRQLQARQRRSRLRTIQTMPLEYISAEFIANERNIEVRNALIRRLGTEQYVKMIGARAVAKDDWGWLYRATIPGSTVEFAAVRVINSTAEPDGTYKEYWLRVPGAGTRQPDLFCTVCGRSISTNPPSTPKGAIAWTFKLCEGHYDPQVMS